MNKLLDLRFVIGLFFLLLAVLLLGYSIASPDGRTASINRWCGIAFGVFAVFMLLLSRGKNPDDEESAAGHQG